MRKHYFLMLTSINKYLWAGITFNSNIKIILKLCIK